jgi:hypothetical protein
MGQIFTLRKHRSKRKTPVNPLKSSKVKNVLSDEIAKTKTKIIHRKNSNKDSEEFLNTLNSFTKNNSGAEYKSERNVMHEQYRDALNAAPSASGRVSCLTGRASSFKMRNIQNIGSFKLDRSVSFHLDGSDQKVRTYQMALREIQVLSHIGRGQIVEVYLG